ALAALVLWLWSYRHRGSIEVSRYVLERERVERVELIVAWGNGRIDMGEGCFEYTGVLLSYGRDVTAAHGAGWKWSAESTGPRFAPNDFDHSWGPFRWASRASKDPDNSFAERYA